MSRFNKNGQNLEGEPLEEWAGLNAEEVKPRSADTDEEPKAKPKKRKSTKKKAKPKKSKTKAKPRKKRQTNRRKNNG